MPRFVPGSQEEKDWWKLRRRELEIIWGAREKRKLEALLNVPISVSEFFETVPESRPEKELMYVGLQTKNPLIVKDFLEDRKIDYICINDINEQKGEDKRYITLVPVGSYVRNLLKPYFPDGFFSSDNPQSVYDELINLNQQVK